MGKVQIQMVAMDKLPEFSSPEQALRYVLEVLQIRQSNLARTAGITPMKLNDMIRGRRPLDDSLLKVLGWERITIYKKIRDGRVPKIKKQVAA